jgi:hypothetical protein
MTRYESPSNGRKAPARLGSADTDGERAGVTNIPFLGSPQTLRLATVLHGGDPSCRSARTVILKIVKCRSLGELVNVCVGTPSAEIPSGVQMLLSQALINVTKTYVTTPEQD